MSSANVDNMSNSSTHSASTTTSIQQQHSLLRPDPPTLEDIASKKSMEEDEMVAQARALALNAQKLAARLKNKPTGLNMLMHSHLEREELPLGDAQQRKLIEEKLGQKLKQDLPSAPISKPLVAGLADVKNKFEGFMLEQQQKFEESLSQFDLSKVGHNNSTNANTTRSKDLQAPIGGSLVDRQEKQQIDDAGTRSVDVAPRDQVPGLIPEKVEKPLLSAIVYKRRSGYGKYSAKHAWERRRMDLVGATVRYFKTLDTNEKDANADGSAMNTAELMPSSDSFSRPSSPFENATSATLGAPQSDAPSTKQKKGLWEQAKENITETFTTNLIHTVDRNGPRGSINLVKENAVVAATSALRAETYSTAMSINMGGMSNVFSSAPPTPFGISIIVKNETKWKICFETQSEQMRWLAVMTEIVVRNNVDNYNEELTKSRRGAPRKSSEGGESENNVIAFNAEESFRSPPGGEDDELWQYSTALSLGRSEHSQSITDQEQSNVDSSAEDVSGDTAVDTVKVIAADTPLSMFHQIVNDGASIGPRISLARRNVLVVSATMNLALKLVFTAGSLWACLFYGTLANMIFWLLVANENLNGRDNQQISSLISAIEAQFFPAHESQTSASKTVKSKKAESSKKEDPKPRLEAPKIKEGFKPIAGCTTKRVRDESESPECNGERFIRWCTLPSEDVQVRSHGYLKTKTKVQSPSSLYEVIGCEILKSGKRLTDIASKVEFPKMEFEGDVGERTWKSPDVFVISLAVPTEEPSITRATTDGEGLSVTTYYKMKKETRDILRKVTASDYDPASPIEEEQVETDVQRRIVNAVKLWEEWCRTAPHDEKMQARFKFIPNVHNPVEVGLPSYIAKYCGKPVLIKRASVTGFLIEHPELNAMEFGISLHPFPYLAKKAMAYLKWAVLPNAIVSLSYVIEGRSVDELPEVIIGDALKLLNPNPEFICECNEFLAGVSKSSIVISTDNDQDSNNNEKDSEDREGPGEISSDIQSTNKR
mmetsp:Transcript_21787/g.32301  ORF Transcript_21787/g.32301 Transcript_21787/m.32301 type:complete len:998 (+) Transcript_21787:156-3149(+)